MELVPLRAHGVGSRGTLPLPWWQFAWAAIAALVLSFLALAVLWRRPVLIPRAEGGSISFNTRSITVLRWVARAIGLALFGLTLGAALFGVDVAGESRNLAPVTIYVMMWVAVPILSVLLGDIWSALNPYRTIGLLFREGDADDAPPHQWWAAGTIFGFLVLELVHPSGDSPRVLGWAMLVYSALMLGGLFRYGRIWLDRADGFGVLFSLIAAMAPYNIDLDGRLRLRPPLSGLSRVTVLPGTMALILVTLGGTSFDGVSESPIFTDIIGRPTGWAAAPPNLIWLVLMIGIATVLYWICASTTAQVTGISNYEAADLFSPALIPIVW